MAASFTLKSRQEIIKTLKKARPLLITQELEIRLAPREELPGCLLIIVPKKVGTAPIRNLIRRRLKALFLEEKLFTLPYTWVFFVRPGLDQWEFGRLRSCILECSAKLSVLS